MHVKQTLSACTIAVASLFASPASPGSPAGEPLSIEPDLRDRLENALYDLGVFEQSSFELALKAFLWDNREYIEVSLVPNYRVADAAVCVLAKRHGYPGLDDFFLSPAYIDFCDELMRGA